MSYRFHRLQKLILWFEQKLISEDGGTDNSSILWILGGVILSSVIVTVIIIIKRKKNLKSVNHNPIPINNNILDIETIFKLKPDLREDDQELVKFIFNNGGKALESELRKKFLQPRTTMWRAVKRLEREGVIEIEKKDLQNLVKLRKNMEEEE
jgi:uncharacterized membrane protein